MKRIIALLCVAALVCCKSKNNKIDTLGELKEATEKASTAMEKSKDRWEERKQKGDTIAIPYKDLQAYLPEISGYTKDGEPSGEQTNMPGMGSWSNAKQRYKDGDKEVDITITDYNGAQGAFSGVTALYMMGYSSENDTKKESTVDMGMKDVVGYETIYKKEPRSHLVVIAADRFFIELDCEGNNDESFLKGIAKSMKLSDLASK